MKRLGRAAALLCPAGFLAGWVALAAGQSEAPRLTVCRHRAADGQGTRPVDLQKVDREYSRVAKAFRERLKGTEERAIALRDRGGDSGLNACSKSERRSLALGEPLPAKLWGRRLYFLAAPGADRVPSGISAPLEPDAIVFLLRYSSLGDAAKLSERLKVGVTPATPALAQRLGIRCHTSIVEVSRDGKTLSIEERAP